MRAHVIMRPLRVLYAPRNIAGQAEVYAKCVRAAGHHAEVWSYGPPAFGFGADRVIDVGTYRSDPGYRWQLLDDAVRGFDVFHFQYGRTLLDGALPELPPLIDLPLLRSLGKKLVMNYRGSDVRLRSKHIEREPDSYLRDLSIRCDEERIAADVSVARRYCDALLVSTPGLLDYVPDALWLPHVVDVSEWRRTDVADEPDRPRVVHMPSRRSTKGSDIVDVVAGALDARGVIEYVPLSGLSRTEIRAEFQRADMVVDSLAIGDHGLVSVEAMAAGAIAVAHVHDRNRQRNPGVPVVEATVHDLGDVLEGLASDPQRRAEIRDASARWIEQVHSLDVVGPRLIDLYRRPSRASGLSYAGFPMTADTKRVRELESEVERLSAERSGGGTLIMRSPLQRVRDDIETRLRPKVRKFYYRTGAARAVGVVRRRLASGHR